MKYPLRPQLRDIYRIELRKAAVTAAGVIAVVRKPIGSRGPNKKVCRLHIHTHRYGIAAAAAYRNCAERERADRGHAQKALACLAWKPNTPIFASLIHLSFSM